MVQDVKLFLLAKNGDKAAKEKIVSDNTGLVWSIARRFMGRGYELEDIYQIGCIGLLKAIERFDYDYEVKFSTYAVVLISGEIKRFLRDDGMVKVSRILKQNGYKISQAKERLSYELGREATLEEIALTTELSVEDIIMATEANMEVESIYKPIYGKDESEGVLVDKLMVLRDEKEDIINRLLLEETMAKLSELERELINCRYFMDKTQADTAKVLNISQVQVSRMEKKILLSMREMMY